MHKVERLDEAEPPLQGSAGAPVAQIRKPSWPRERLIKFCLAFLAPLISARYTCQAQDLAGVWQTEVSQRTIPGRTNKLSNLETIEFFHDLTFKITDIVIVDGKGSTNMPFRGSYTVINTNKFQLKVIALNLPPGSTLPAVSLEGVVVGGEIKIPRFISSVVPEYNRYRRVKGKQQ